MRSWHDFTKAFFIFSLSFLVIILADLLHISSNILQEFIIVLLTLLILLSRQARLGKLQRLLQKQGKWEALLLTTLLVQLIVLSIGDVRGPFLILWHLFVLGLSIVFSFDIALLFLAFSLSTLGLHSYIHGSLYELLLSDPPTTILYALSFATIIPIAQIISHRYHLKENLAQALTKQITVEEAILADVHELIFVTDQHTRILSVNEAAERALQISQSELLQRPLFDVLLMRDHLGQLLDKSRFAFGNPTTDKPVEFPEVMVLSPSQLSSQRLHLRAKPIADLEDPSYQISFVLWDNHRHLEDQAKEAIVEAARMKYQALMVEVQNQLKSTKPELAARLLLAQTIELDTMTALAIAGQTVITKPSLVDIAKLTRQVVASTENFSKAFGVKTVFSLEHFGEADIAPLTTTTFQVSPEELTGPFFTAAADAKYTSLILEKLIQLSIMLGSGQASTVIKVSVDRRGNNAILIQIELPSFLNVPTLASFMFTKDYGELNNQTNVRYGSGLEGWIAQELARQLGIGLSVVHLPVGDSWAFQVLIHKSTL
jgi:PAS domain-containing protein